MQQSVCVLCNRIFRGQERNQLRTVPEWKAQICLACLGICRNGVDPGQYPHVLPYLASRGIAPQLDAFGRIDIPMGAPIRSSAPDGAAT